MATRYDWRFTELTLAEKVRVQKEALRHGFTVLPIADEVKGIEAESILVIPSSDIPREDFAHFDDVTFEAFQRYYATVERSTIYPPLGYAPSMRKEEREAAALLSFIITVAEKWGENTLECYYYPVARINSPTSEKRPSLATLLTSLFR